MSRPRWRVYEVRSTTWSSVPNTISTCSTALRSPSRRLSTRLRTIRPPSWARAQRRSAPSPMTASRCWKTVTPDGRSWMLATARRAWAARFDLERAGEQALGDRLALGARDRRSGRDELLHEIGFGADPETDDRPGDEGSIGGAGGPADDDRVGEADAIRDDEPDALAPEAPRQLGELVVGRQRGGAFEVGAQAVGIAGQCRAECLEGHAGGERLGRQRQRRDGVLAQFDDRRDAIRRLGRGAVSGRGCGSDVRPCRRRGRRPAGRRTSCRAGSSRAAAPRRPWPRRCAPRAARPARIARPRAPGRARRPGTVNGSSAGPRRAGRRRLPGEDSAAPSVTGAVTRANPPSRASPGG